MAELRKHINAHCKSCIYDDGAPGTWLQQVTLCTLRNCQLWNVRPKTTSGIPESVLFYHQVKLVGSEYVEASLGVEDER